MEKLVLDPFLENDKMEYISRSIVESSIQLVFIVCQDESYQMY